MPSVLSDCPDVRTTPPAEAGGTVHVRFNHDGRAWHWSEGAGLGEQPPPDSPFWWPEEASRSEDGTLAAHAQTGENGVHEVWVTKADASEPQLLVQVSEGEVIDRHPDAVAVHLRLRWLGETHRLAYWLEPEFDGIGWPPQEAVRMVDVDTGDGRELLAFGEFACFQSSPNGSQIAALRTEGGEWDGTHGNAVQLIDATTGLTDHVVPIEGIASIPCGMVWNDGVDSRWLAVQVSGGLTIIDATDGSERHVPMAHPPRGPWTYHLLPQKGVVDEEEAHILVVAPGDESSAADPSADTILTVWRLNPGDVSADLLHEFDGWIGSVQSSPDGRTIASWTQTTQNERDVYLADLETGEQVRYYSGGAAECCDWSPDSRRFVLWERYRDDARLGGPCEPMRNLGDFRAVRQVTWVDPNRLIVATEPREGAWEFHLHAVDGETTFIARGEGELPVFEVEVVRSP